MTLNKKYFVFRDIKLKERNSKMEEAHVSSSHDNAYVNAKF